MSGRGYLFAAEVTEGAATTPAPAPEVATHPAKPSVSLACAVRWPLPWPGLAR